MAENMNIRVKKRGKNNIVPIFVVALIILIGIIGVIIYGKEESRVNDEVNDPNIDVYAGSNEDNNDQNNEITDEVKKVYQKFNDATWISKNYVPKSNIFYVEDKKIVCESTISNKKEILDLEYGDAKYVYNAVNSGVLTHVAVVSEDGRAFVINVSNNVNADGNYNLDKLTLQEVKVNSKVVDMLINANGMFPGSSPYFLTESGKLYNKDARTYEQVNRNHINYCGNIRNLVFINENKTLEILRNNASNEYFTILDSSGENVTSKIIFVQNTDNEKETFYVVDKENRFLEFSSSSIYVASEVYEAEERKVKNINYSKSGKQVKINFTDEYSIILDDIYQYIEIK